MNLLERPDINPFLGGVLDVTQTDHGWLLSRMSPHQTAYYDQDRGWRLRARCNAGQTLEFRSDAARITLAARVTAAAQLYLGIDVEVDGVVRRSVRINPVKNPLRLQLIDLAAEDRRERDFRIHLPNATALCLGELLLDGATQVAPLPPHAAGPVLLLGDSITQGLCAVSPYATLAVQLARLRGAGILNQGVAGHIIDPRSLPTRLPVAPSLAVVAYGTNDWAAGTSRRHAQELITAYLSTLRDALPSPAPIVFVSPIWRADAHTLQVDGGLETFGLALCGAAEALQSVTAVNGYELVPHTTTCFTDGAHPNELGFMHYALNLHRSLLT